MTEPHIHNTINFLQEEVATFHREGRKVYLSSSFQTQSVPLLHLMSLHLKNVKVVFIDTGYLFAETYAFKQTLEKQFGLDIITVASPKGYKEQQTSHGLLLYSDDTDRCCHINKVEPIEGLIAPGDVWISGVRRDQTAIRQQMQPKEIDQRGVVRVHPMLDWNSKNVYDYIRANNLPKHPLENAGYVSIGCVPCTHSWTAQSERGGRWVGQKKTECGLHTENRTA